MNYSLNTIKRLSIYKKTLKDIAEEGKKFVFSSELAKRVGVKASQVRKDLWYFGPFGKKKVGYEIDQLIQRLNDILGVNQVSNVIVIGVGNVGRALIAYKGFYREQIRIIAGFDLRNRVPVRETPIYSIKALGSFLEDNRDVRIAILCVPAENAQEVTNHLIRFGIKGVLNFAPVTLNVPEDFYVININIAAELESLFFLTSLKDKSGREVTTCETDKRGAITR